jgi:beta-galactosidase/beta-glucuronidase
MADLRTRFLLATFVLWLTATTVHAWEPVEGQLMTQWAKDVLPDNALPEYPRPQMMRKSWVNLNGLWQYAIRPAKEKKPTNWDGEILVPFAVESALSGVKKAVQPDERLWYRRTFETPSKNGERLLLHFGAVDWKCIVWVNGKQVGEHTGGYDPFTFDVTDALNSDADKNELVVAVSDPTDTGTQPRGKQVLKPHGIMYTAVTGIWQTAWLEPVPSRYVQSLRVASNVDNGTVTVTTKVSSPGVTRLSVISNGKAITTGKAANADTVAFAVPNVRLWSPEDPYLYQLRVELLNGDKVVDTVDSYFGMRKIEVKKDADGINRLWLNNKVVFQYGPLDQGWWPDGLYTAPTDEALKYDIEMTKRLGFNMARKHVKVEPDRWYYWCDKLGLLVWQDMPSGDADKSDESKSNYRRELQAMIDALHNHPSIVMWVPFNEGHE